MKHVRLAVAAASVAGLILVQPWTAAPTAQVTNWFRSDFNNPNAAGTNNYNFAGRFPTSSTTWLHDHQSTGGWNGSGGAHVLVKGCPQGGCSTQVHQYNVGWGTENLNRTPSMGESAFVRFRIKFDPNTVFTRDSFWAKFILFGTTGTSPNSRWIIHLFPTMGFGYCMAGSNYNDIGWTPPSWMWTTAAQFGLPANFDQAPVDGVYGSFVSTVNISGSCNPAVLVSRSNNANPPKPQSVGAAPVNGWYHLQFQATTGQNGTADFRTWANNNNQGSPSSERLNMPDGLGVTGWGDAVSVGGYWGTAMPGDIGFVIDDFEIGPSFDPNWYPGGGTQVPPPSTPSGVRIVSN
jgi:hypothetical protein